MSLIKEINELRKEIKAMKQAQRAKEMAGTRRKPSTNDAAYELEVHREEIRRLRCHNYIVMAHNSYGLYSYGHPARTLNRPRTTASISTTKIVMAYIVMAYVVMASNHGLHFNDENTYGLYSYGLCSYGLEPRPPFQRRK